MKSAAVIVQAGTDWSIASCTVHRPSPESSTHPRIFWSAGSSASARPASSTSHDRTTLPCIQRSAIRGRSRPYGLLCIRAKPSAMACIMPYSIPLWTIFT